MGGLLARREEDELVRRILCLLTAGAIAVGALTVVSAAQSPAAAQDQGENCDNLLVLVDRENRLPPDYGPADLVYLSAYGVPDLGEGELLRQGAAANLSRMVSDAAYYGGVELVAADGWRSYQTQQGLYSYWESVYGPGAGGVSAPPGASMHQLGTTVDFTNAYAGYGLNYYLGTPAPTTGF
jgi:LAS superfamily LD-carboxypeptidase LdcB